MPVKTQIQIRRGAFVEWSGTNPVLANGELSLDTTSKLLKAGDGVTEWRDLPYIGMNEEEFQDRLSESLAGASGIGIDYQDDNDILYINVTGIDSSQVNDFTEAVQDAIALSAGNGFLVNNTGVVWNYDDESNNLSVAVTGIDHTLITYWDAALSGNIDTQLVAGSGIDFTFDENANTLTISTAVLDDSHTHIWDNISDAKQRATLDELAFLSGVIPGSVSASRALVVDANSDISGLGNVISNNGITAVVFSVDLVGDVTGNADSATEATTVTVTSNDSEDASLYLTFVDENSGAQDVEVDSLLRYNPLTNTVSVGNVSATGTVSADHVSSSTLTTTGNVQIGGDLSVAGTTTTVNSTVVNIGDNVIRVNASGLPTGGFEVYVSGDDPNAVVKQLIWNNTNDRWEFTGVENVFTSGNITANTFTSEVATGTAPFTVSSTTLVDNLNADLLDGEHGSYYRNFSNISGVPTPDVTVTLSGDVAGTDTFSSWDINNNLNIGINTAIQPNSVALETDTTGAYTESVGVTGSGIDISNSTTGDDGANYTINLNSTSNNAGGTIVVRYPAGSFSANTITASFFSGDGSLLTNLNGSNITTGTVDPLRLPLASTIATGIAVFDSSDFGVTVGGKVSIKVGGVSNAQLVNDSVTIGVTEFVLGVPGTAVSGLTQLAGTSSANPVYIEWAVIDGGTP